MHSLEFKNCSLAWTGKINNKNIMSRMSLTRSLNKLNREYNELLLKTYN